jgi:dihydroflavonol-4-reductase
MKAFVTGGTGFIGANLVAALNDRDIDVRILHRESSSTKALAGLRYESVLGDILAERPNLVKAMSGCDWVFHVAAVADYWRQGAEWMTRVNVTGTENVMAAAREAGVKRFVFTSSLAALGIPQSGSLLTETSQFNFRPTQFPYGYSKHLAELAVQKAVAAGLQAVIVNPTVVLGPRDINAISGSIILEAAKGYVRFTFPGGVNYVAVEDVVAGHIAAAEKGRIGERYILAGENISHKSAFQTVCRVVQRPLPKLQIPGRLLPILARGVSAARLFLGNRIPLDANQVRMAGAYIYADGSKAVHEFGLPQTPLETAVQQTYAWYAANGYL